ncbi:MAG: hypothetical protein AB1758_30520, partial [Candidatus Eremiobacterota bacterium]
LAAIALGAYLWRPSGPPPPLPLQGHSLAIVCLDEGDRKLMERAAESLRRNTGLEAGTALSAVDTNGCLDPDRGQLEAERILQYAEQGQRDWPVLVVLNHDLFTSGKPEWRYCFGLRGERASVLSAARLKGSRLDKMLARYAAQLLIGFPPSHDPRSLFYSPIMGPADIDRMELSIPTP